MTQRLPIPGQDNGTWGDILNGFLEVSLNSDGTIQTSALTQSGGEVTANKGIASGYASLNSSGLVPTTQLGSGTAGDSNYLRGDGTWVTPSTGSNATYSNPGLVQLAGDLGGGVSGTATSPQVTSTHLSSALPIIQGGTGSSSQNFVDLSSNQTISGTKIFSSNISGNITGNAATVTTIPALTGDVTSNGSSNATTVDKLQGTVAISGTASADQVLTATSSNAASWAAIPTITFTEGHNYSVSGPIAVPSGATNYLPPFFEPVASSITKTLIDVRYVIRAGTSVTFEVTQNGSVVSGLSSLLATTTASTTAPTTAPTVSNYDAFAVVVTAVSGTPDGLTVTLIFQSVT